MWRGLGIANGGVIGKEFGAERRHATNFCPFSSIHCGKKSTTFDYVKKWLTAWFLG